MDTADLALTVVIPHFNQPSELRRCLNGLLDPEIGKNVALIVVDNGSTTFPHDLATDYPSVKFLLQPDPGPGPARNLGVSVSNTPNIAFIDADCFPDSAWLSEILTALRTAPGIIGGDVKVGLADQKRPTIWECYENQYGFRMDKYVAREGFSGAGNLAMPRAIFDAVGPFAGLGVAEDRDFGLRARALGYKTRYVPTMIVYHPARKSWDEVARKWDRQTGHQYADYRARRFGRVKWTIRTLAMLASPVAELPAIFTSKRIPGGRRGRLLCLAALIRVRAYRTRLMAFVLVTDDPDRLAKRWRNS